eukprot:CAMPEP_0174244150 /NCGR_PEP_ID=MMETSP0417-20130205/34232_1 /TAXON_ID=242541 /ORGANISM="Mayorella sp, Strain BSH-02190019" /LENGTH=290 /DNA_ID=CAMNT_0015323785 /DNA_START=72 /DNA_END=940 /DNA_ORIENTATION=-
MSAFSTSSSCSSGVVHSRCSSQMVVPHSVEPLPCDIATDGSPPAPSLREHTCQVGRCQASCPSSPGNVVSGRSFVSGSASSTESDAKSSRSSKRSNTAESSTSSSQTAGMASGKARFLLCAPHQTTFVGAFDSTASTVLEPRPPLLETSIHSLPRAFGRIVQPVFCHRFPVVHDFVSQVCIIITFQPAVTDLLSMSAAASAEKDRLIEIFFAWAEALRKRIQAEDYWFDYMDPSSGYPMHEPRGGSIYSTMSGIQVLLPYRVSNSGGCWLVSHPRFKTSIYPATAFTTAP